MGESSAATPERAEEILAFWFAARAFDGPVLDSRMKLWFGTDAVFDSEIRERFADDVEHALGGGYRDWAETPRGRLGLILLLDQFTRNIHRGQADAFVGDRQALKLTLDGIQQRMDRALNPVERAFFYMPMQHAEHAKVQALSVKAFNGLTRLVDDTLRETFQTMAEFAELHRDIVERFGRFPHRNRLLGRENTDDERIYLDDDGHDFGQGVSPPDDARSDAS